MIVFLSLLSGLLIRPILWVSSLLFKQGLMAHQHDEIVVNKVWKIAAKRVELNSKVFPVAFFIVMKKMYAREGTFVLSRA